MMKTYEKIDLYAYFNLPRPKDADGYLNAYIIDDYKEFSAGRIRPAMLVIPGGGYWMCSEREDQTVALKYLAEGFQSFVLSYSVRGKKGDLGAFDPLKEACMAIRYIRENAEKFALDPDKIATIGFSAGGHLAASLSTMYGDKEITDVLGQGNYRPDATVLCYPVITFGEGTHVGSRENLVGKGDEYNERFSCEKRVIKDTPPTFIWTTSEDQCVPPVNSLYYASALSLNKVPFEMHVYEHGAHGLSLCNEEVDNGTGWSVNGYNAKWFGLSVAFLKDHGFKPNK
ncbi:MAG: alpha/beta hydrolase [Clostridia bacterium]|nr:alpha/beta hydrolase [Clostridia bacterium]